MKTITIDLTDWLYYALPIAVFFILVFKRQYKVRKEIWNEFEYEDYLLIFLLSSVFTALASIIYFVVLHLLLDFNYTFKL